MKHGSLFSGIGGFDLAAEWAGWENVFHCEWNPFGQQVLKHYWPDAESFYDITKSDFSKYEHSIDVISGGFPCQPYSTAGKRKGKNDERHLWPEMLRAIREVAPRYVVGENVLGLTNWNGGAVFDEVHTDLELAGYEVAAVVIPAAAVNAPHGRDRVWFVARRNATYAMRDGFNQRDCENEIEPSKGWFHALNDLNAIAMHANGTSKSGKYVGQAWKGKFNRSNRGNEFDKFQNFPTESPICGGNDGLSKELDGITFPKWREESLKAYGNAIVPQVALQIFNAINEYEKLHR